MPSRHCAVTFSLFPVSGPENSGQNVLGWVMPNLSLWSTHQHPTPAGWGPPSCSPLLCECSVSIFLACLSSCPHPVALGPVGQGKVLGVLCSALPPSLAPPTQVLHKLLAVLHEGLPPLSTPDHPLTTGLCSCAEAHGLRLSQPLSPCCIVPAYL